MPTALLLLRPKILSAKNSINKRVIMRRLPFALVGAAFAVLIYLGSYKALLYLRSAEFIGEAMSKKLLSMVFFSLSGFLLLSNIITAISAFYLSRDLPFLLTLPIDKKDILSLKTIETSVNSSWMTASFLPPVFLAYGAAYGAPAGYYIVALFCLFTFMLLASALGIAIAHALTRIFPAKGMRDILLFLSLLVFLSAYFILSSSAPKGEAGPEELLGAMMSFRVESPLLPSFWASEAVWSSLSQGLKIGPLYPVLLLSNCLFFLMVSSLSGSALYQGNLERIRPKASGRLESNMASVFYPGHRFALLYKDAKVFVRDTSQWSQVLVIGALLLVYVYNFRSVPIGAVSRVTPLIKEIVAVVNLVMSGLVMSAVAARFVYSSVSLEGQAFWALRTSPFTMKRFLWGKLAHGFWPLSVVTLSLVFLTGLATGTSWTLMAASLAIVALLSFSISGLGTGLGAMYPKFRYEHIASVSMSIGGMAFMAIAFTLVLITVALSAWPFYLYYSSGGLKAGDIALTAFLIILINSIAFYLPMRMGIKRLERLEE